MPPPISFEMAAQETSAPPMPSMFEQELVAEEPQAYNGSSQASTDDLERLRELWPRVIDQINARSKNIAAVFRDSNLVRPERVAPGVCTVAFRYPIQAERCRKEPWRAISRVLGREVRVESVLFDQAEGEGENGAGGGRANGNGASTAPPSPYETPRGKAAMNIFGITKFDDVE
jgi:hypothetical protein